MTTAYNTITTIATDYFYKSFIDHIEEYNNNSIKGVISVGNTEFGLGRG